MKKWSLFLIICHQLIFVMAQPTIEWQKSLGGSKYDEALAVRQTSDLGYITAGHCRSTDGDVTDNHGSIDYWVVKINGIGYVEWQRTYGGNDIDWLHDAQVTPDGGSILVGTSASNDQDVSGNHGDYDVWVVKLDGQGNILWQKSLGGSGWEEAWAVQVTSDNGYIIVGHSDSVDGDVTGNHGGSTDFWVIKLNVNGNIEWQKSLGGNLEDLAYGVKETFDGGYLVVGESESIDGDVSGNHGQFDYWIVKLNSLGIIEWEKSFGSNSLDRANDVCLSSDGGYVVAGIVSGNNGDVTGLHGSTYDIWAIKLDSLGNLQWQKTLGGSDLEAGQSVQQLNGGGYIIAGQTQSTDGDVINNDGGADFWLVKLSGLGEIQWQKTLGGTSGDWANCIQQTSDGGFITSGRSSSSNGDLTNNHGSADFWIVKLSSESVNVEENPREADSLTLFPNPSSGKLFITPKEDILLISIADLMGRVILYPTLGADRSISMYNLPNGIYSASIITRGGKVLKANFVKQE